MDKNNLGIIKDMAKLFSATILSGLFFTGCVDMDLTPKNQPSEGEVWADATMAEQTVTGLYNGLNHLYNDNYNMWFDCFSAVMDRDANWRNFGMLFGNQTTSAYRIFGISIPVPFWLPSPTPSVTNLRFR